MSILLKIFEFIEEWLGPFIMVVIIVDVFLQIMSRILPGNAIPWTVELGQMLLGALIWLCISEGVKKGSHVCLDLVVRTFSKKYQKLIGIINNGLFIIYLSLMSIFTVEALEYYTRLGTKSTVMQISMFWVRMPILVGCIMTIIRLLIKEYRIITNKETVTFSDSITEGSISEGGI